MRIQGKIIVIVGGASELATATAKRCLAEEVIPVLVHHKQESLDRVLPAYGDRQIETRIADVRDFNALQQVFAGIAKTWGRLDVIINCAAIVNHKPIDDMSEEDWQSVIDVNLTGAFNVCRAVTPIMKSACCGRIVNVASLGGRTGRPGVGVNYAASKAGMIGLTQTLARELAPWGITVNAVAPGPLKGRMFSGMLQESQDKLSAGIPLGRVGEMDDVAGAILFLASDDSAWITGEVLDVNGGIFM
jgi:NAD(P)-dependent dehydrogenase (short-subunit alcohol dehydrogenase family)